MLLSFLIMGMFLDDTAMLVIVAPLYIPLVIRLGFNLIWFGILYTITCQIAYITPPFGYNLFLMRAMAPPEITHRRHLSVDRAVLLPDGAVRDPHPDSFRRSRCGCRSSTRRARMERWPDERFHERRMTAEKETEQ